MTTPLYEFIVECYVDEDIVDMEAFFTASSALSYAALSKMHNADNTAVVLGVREDVWEGDHLTSRRYCYPFADGPSDMRWEEVPEGVRQELGKAMLDYTVEAKEVGMVSGRRWAGGWLVVGSGGGGG